MGGRTSWGQGGGKDFSFVAECVPHERSRGVCAAVFWIAKHCVRIGLIASVRLACLLHRGPIKRYEFLPREDRRVLQVGRGSAAGNVGGRPPRWSLALLIDPKSHPTPTRPAPHILPLPTTTRCLLFTTY